MFDGIIYKYTCIPTGLSYVGQAIGDGSIRHSQFMSLGTRHTSGRSAIDNARRKYGPSSFTYEILERVECDTLESRSALLNEREVYWISYYDTYKHGYNSTTGGLGSSGFKQPRHVVEMLHNRRASEETLRKKSIPVLCYRISSGEFVGEFYGAHAAARELGISSASITACCSSLRSRVYDYLFVYKADASSASNRLETLRSSSLKRGKRRDLVFTVYGFSVVDGSFVKSWPSVKDCAADLGLLGHTTRLLDTIDGVRLQLNGFILLRSMDLVEVARRVAIDPYAGCKSRIIAEALKRCRRVEVTCLSTGEVTVCPSITKSSEFTGVCRSSISLCCQGKRKSASGYVFRYVD